MKKIVALVLSLVMALSLATVAFAYPTTGTAVYGLDAKNNVNKDDVRPVAVSSVKAYTYKDGTGYIAYYNCDWNDDGVTDSYLIPCTQDDADFAIYKNGSFSTWVFESFATDNNGMASDAYYDAIAKVQKATSAKANCTTTQYLEDGYTADGNFYVADKNGAVSLNVDGKIVKAIDVTGDYDYVIAASHIFAKGVANDKTGYDVATCLICKGEFACTNDEAVATKNGYKISTGFKYDTWNAQNVYDVNKYDNGYDFAWGQTYASDYEFCWQLKAGTTEEIGKTTDTTKDGVNSAKTFDAGIAMYVGMSLLSVAGSAVVIGKKKEF